LDESGGVLMISNIKTKIKKLKEDYSKVENLTTPMVSIRILRATVKGEENQATTVDEALDFLSPERTTEVFDLDGWTKKTNVSYEVIYSADSEVVGGELKTYKHKLYRETVTPYNVIEINRNLHEGIIGVLIEDASVYGAIARVSMADFSNDIKKNIRANDFLFIWVFDLNDIVDKKIYTLLDAKEILSTKIDIYIKYKKPDFGGFITHVYKHIKDKNKTNIDASDMNRYIQQYHIPKVSLNKYGKALRIRGEDLPKSYRIDNKYNDFSAVNNFFAEAIIEALRRGYITLDAGNSSHKKNIQGQDVLIRHTSEIEYVRNAMKVFVSFQKGSVMILKIHPTVLVKIIYKYFFYLIGMDLYFYPEIDLEKFLNVIDKNKNINKNNFITIGIIFKGQEEAEAFDSAMTNDDVVHSLIVRNEMLYNFNFGYGNLFFVSSDKTITIGQLLLSSIGELYISDGNEYHAENIFNLPLPHLGDVDQPNAQAKELIDYFRHNIFNQFQDTMNIERLIHRNAYDLRSQKILSISKYISSPLVNENTGVSFLFLLKSLFFSFTGIFEPIYNYTELMGDTQHSTQGNRKIFNSIRNTMWIRIYFEIHSKDVTDVAFTREGRQKKIYLKAVLKNDFVTHGTQRGETIEEKDILEFQENQIIYPLSTINIRTPDGNILITDEGIREQGQNWYMNIHPSSVVALDFNVLCSYPELPITYNSYMETKTVSSPAIYHNLITETTKTIYDESNFPPKTMSLNLEDLAKIPSRARTLQLIRYISNDDKVADDSVGVKNLEMGVECASGREIDYIFGDEEYNRSHNHKNLVGVIKYLNPVPMIEELLNLKDLMGKTESYENVHGAIDYSKYKDLKIVIRYDLNENENMKHFVEKVLEETENKGTLKFKLEELLDKIEKYFRKEGYDRDKVTFWARKLPTKVWLLENDTCDIDFADVINYHIYEYDTATDTFITDSQEGFAIKNTVFSEYFYTIKFLYVIYKSISRYYDELLATQSKLISLYIPANKVIDVADKIRIQDDGVPLGSELGKMKRFGDVSVGIPQTHIDGKRHIYLPEDVRNIDLFVWKKIIYIGDAGGTSGFTRKLYMTDNPLIWVLKFEDKDITTRLAGSIQNKLGLTEALK